MAYHFREALPQGIGSPIAPLMANGYLAVDLFFVLSGYVIGLNYAAWFHGGDRLRRYTRFLALRLSRIYPLHVVMLALFLATPITVALFSQSGNPLDMRWSYYCLSILLMQNWGFTDGLAWNVPAWSISTEWMAYLCFPLIVAAAEAVTRRRLAAIPAVIGLSVALWTCKLIQDPAVLGYNEQILDLFRCLTEFSAGVCVWRFASATPCSRFSDWISLCLSAIVFAALGIWNAPTFLLAPIGFSLLVYGLSGETGLIARGFHSKILQWLGLISYSTYLCHYFVKVWLKFILLRPSVPAEIVFPTYLAVVLAASALLYHLVEQPGQRWSRRLIQSAMTARNPGRATYSEGHR